MHNLIESYHNNYKKTNDFLCAFEESGKQIIHCLLATNTCKHKLMRHLMY